MSFEEYCAERFGGKAVLWGQIVNGPIRLVPSMRCCFVGDKQVKFSPKETRLMEVIMRVPGQPVCCEVIWKECWDEPEMNLTALRLHFSHLRDRFKSAGFKGSIIIAFNRKGYGIQDLRRGFSSQDLSRLPQ